VPDDENKPEDDKPAEPPPGDDQAAAGDNFRPEAIAARVEGLGEEDAPDRLAREEEQKLLERRKGKKGKKGLEAAASKRLAKIGEVKVKRPSALTEGASADADPLLERAGTAAHLEHQIGAAQEGVPAAIEVRPLLGRDGLPDHGPVGVLDPGGRHDPSAPPLHPIDAEAPAAGQVTARPARAVTSRPPPD